MKKSLFKQLVLEVLKEVKRDGSYYIQHLLDIDPNQSAEDLLKELHKNLERWCNMYDPILMGNSFGWQPTATLTMGEYVLQLIPQIVLVGNRFNVYSINIKVQKIDMSSKKSTRIKDEEVGVDIHIDQQRDWDISSLAVKIANTIREIKKALKVDFKIN